MWRIFFDKGGYKGQNFQALSALPDVHFYTPAVRYSTNVEQREQLEEGDFDPAAFFLSAWLRCLTFNLMSLFAKRLGGDYSRMWVGTLLRKFIRRPATLYLIGNELHVVFDPFQNQDDLRPLLDELNAKRVQLPWLNGLVVQFSIEEDEPLHPLTEPEKRNRLLGDG